MLIEDRDCSSDSDHLKQNSQVTTFQVWLTHSVVVSVRTVIPSTNPATSPEHGNIQGVLRNTQGGLLGSVYTDQEARYSSLLRKAAASKCLRVIQSHRTKPSRTQKRTDCLIVLPRSMVVGFSCGWVQEPQQLNGKSHRDRLTLWPCLRISVVALNKGLLRPSLQEQVHRKPSAITIHCVYEIVEKRKILKKETESMHVNYSRKGPWVCSDRVIMHP